MTAALVGVYPTGSPEWFAARAGKMTGSRIAAAAGLSPYESRFALYFRMLGQISEVEETAPMEWGTRLEAAVFQKFADTHPELQVTATGTWVHLERDWQSGNPDGLICDAKDWQTGRAILEIKTARYDDNWGTPGTDEIPVHYRAQVLWYLDTLGMDTAHVAVLIAGSDYREYIVHHDETECAMLREIGRQFLDDLANGVRPDINQDGSTYQAIKELHPEINGDRVDITDDTGYSLIRAKNKADDWAAIAQQYRSEMADQMGNAKSAYWRGVKIADRRAKKAPGSIPYVQLVNNLPSLEIKEAS
jgi:putative phage-type endonuclease